MEPKAAVAMIIMGTVLILAPIGADYLFQRNVVVLLLGKEPSISPMVISRLSTFYSVVCWLTGSLMVLVSAVASADPRTRYLVEEDDEAYDEEKDEEK